MGKLDAVIGDLGNTIDNFKKEVKTIEDYGLIFQENVVNLTSVQLDTQVVKHNLKILLSKLDLGLKEVVSNVSYQSKQILDIQNNFCPSIQMLKTTIEDMTADTDNLMVNKENFKTVFKNFNDSYVALQNHLEQLIKIKSTLETLNKK